MSPRILHAQASGRFTEAERTIAMTDAILSALLPDPDISDFEAWSREMDAKAERDFIERHGVARLTL